MLCSVYQITDTVNEIYSDSKNTSLHNRLCEHTHLIQLLSGIRKPSIIIQYESYSRFIITYDQDIIVSVTIFPFIYGNTAF